MKALNCLFFIAAAVAGLLGAPEGRATVPTREVKLFNGIDLSGWEIFPVQARETWTVREGVIHCTGEPFGYIRTSEPYAEYLLHLEWRWPGKPGNSGVFVHMSLPDKTLPRAFECQLMSGDAGYFWMLGVTSREHSGQGIRSSNVGKPEWYRNGVAPLKPSSEKPPGEWNAYQIICKDDWIVVLVNGVLQNVATEVSDRSGRICLQSEGAPIEFRNIWLEPLDIQ
jgi:hypothetical protein